MPPQIENNTVPPISISQTPLRGHVYLLILTFLLIPTGVFGIWYFSHPLPDEDMGSVAMTGQFAGWKTYRNTEYGFEFQYPQSWLSPIKNTDLLNESDLRNEPANVTNLSATDLSKIMLKTDSIAFRMASSTNNYFELTMQEYNNNRFLELSCYEGICDEIDIPTLRQEIEKNPDLIIDGYKVKKANGSDGRTYTIITDRYELKINIDLIPNDSENISVLQTVDKIISSFKFISTSTVSTLPPDPGTAGKTTLAGIDSNKDGVRDDVERYIYLTYPDSAKVRAALMQVTKADQDFFILGTTSSTALAQAKVSLQAKSCLYFILGGVVKGQPVRDALDAQLLNTNERSLAYIQANNLLAGQLFRQAPTSGADACQFDLKKMAN